ncbi:PREDICTED: uncharacterized protein LOC104615876, partial [Phaethon lepturus]|uniref:uncharacterized protein LOC104615876 n=1 Tax=Phaethon lepturus TaxID=97097 RepID=UPI00053050E1
DQACRSYRVLRKKEVHEPNICRTHEDGGLRQERNLYQTVEVDNRDLCLPGESASVTDLRVRYIPAEPNEQLEVRVIPESCKPETIAYLIHVIQNLNDPDATTYEIVCHQPHDLGQPVYVKKCYVSPQPPVVPCDRSNHPEPQPQRDERETGEPKPLRQGGTPPSTSQENTGDLNEPQKSSETVKEGAHLASTSKPCGVKGHPLQAKTKEDRRDGQCPRMPDVEEKEHHPKGDGSKSSREKVPWEPESRCQVRECEDREATSCPPLPRALEPQEACEPGQQATKESRRQPPQRDEASCCHEDAELLPPKTHQPWEKKSKRSPQQGLSLGSGTGAASPSEELKPAPLGPNPDCSQLPAQQPNPTGLPSDLKPAPLGPNPDCSQLPAQQPNPTGLPSPSFYNVRGLRGVASNAQQPTETERCIESLLAVFQRYAGREGDSCTLSKREFLAFMNTELAAFTKNQKDPGVVDRMMKKLDLNSDGQLDFQEFLNLIGGIAVACHNSLVVKAPSP